MNYSKTLTAIALACYQAFAAANVVEHFNTIKSSPLELYAFFKEMPKGGELHYHLDGGAYPEAMLAIAAKNNYCLASNSFVISPSKEKCEGLLASELGNHPNVYNQVIHAWSMKDFIPGSQSGHDKFFGTFSKFMPLAINHPAELLADVMQRAANQHEQYLEVMILPDGAQSTAQAPSNITMDNLAATKKQLLSNANFNAHVDKTIAQADNLLQDAKALLGCPQSPKQAVCQLTVRFQYYVLREQPLEKIFTQALNGFAATARSKGLVGVNLVQEEDGYIALHDYHQQMQIFQFLHKEYPSVHISLHAGELSPQSVAPEQIRFHIQDAIKTGQAERIGHGVSVAYENHAQPLLTRMSEKPIPVEINLISNKKILGVEGAQHPLNLYLNHDVPVVLSSDDEGVLRTDLTAQYVEAAFRYGLDYPILKQINRNALTYSFLPGKSLWSDPKRAIRVNACQVLSSTDCDRFTNENEKARVQRQLERKLTEFEKRFDNPHGFPVVG